MEFYNVKKRKKVKIADDKCTKIVYKRVTAKGPQDRYAARAVDTDGVKLTIFLSKDAFDALKCKEEAPPAKKKAPAKKK